MKKRILAGLVILLAFVFTTGIASATGKFGGHGHFRYPRSGFSTTTPRFWGPPVYHRYDYPPPVYRHYGPRVWMPGHWTERWTPYGWQRSWVPGYWR